MLTGNILRSKFPSTNFPISILRETSQTLVLTLTERSGLEQMLG